MIIDYVTILGLIAASLTTVSFVPQVVRTWKTRRTKDISLAMFSLFSLGIFLWLVYGLLTLSIPIIFANIITLVLAVIILGFKIKYK